MEPLTPSWHGWSVAPQRAGVRTSALLTITNDGSATWRSRGADGLQVSYHWLDPHGNAIVWDGLRTALPQPVGPGETVELEVALVAPRPPGRYVLRFDFVEEHHFWLSEVGVAGLDVELDVEPRIASRRLAVVVHGGADPLTTAALEAQDEPLVALEPTVTAHLVAGSEPAPDWARRMLDAHAEGWEAVGPALVPAGRLLRRWRDRRRLAAWAPAGRNPRFDGPLLLPSLLEGVEPTTVDGLPAYVGDDGLFEGAALVRLPTRSGRRRA